jgi:hypothetical protein
MTTAVTPKTQSTHHADAASSWPQSIDGLNGSDSNERLFLYLGVQ